MVMPKIFMVACLSKCRVMHAAFILCMSSAFELVKDAFASILEETIQLLLCNWRAS